MLPASAPPTSEPEVAGRGARASFGQARDSFAWSINPAEPALPRPHPIDDEGSARHTPVAGLSAQSYSVYPQGAAPRLQLDREAAAPPERSALGQSIMQKCRMDLESERKRSVTTARSWGMGASGLGATPVPSGGVAVAARPGAVLQAKMEVGSVDDPLEHEADQVADTVLRMADPALAAGAPEEPPGPPVTAAAQRETTARQGCTEEFESKES
jgi:hypothetical protein